LTPCPVSGFFAMIVTVPSAAMLMNEVGTSGGGGGAPCWTSAAASGSK
jgi:hypothetical protein